MINEWTYQIIKIDLCTFVSDDRLDLFFRLYYAPQRPESARSGTPNSYLPFESIHAVLRDFADVDNFLVSAPRIHLYRKIRTVEVFSLLYRRIGGMVRKRMCVSRVVIVGLPFMEVIGDIKAAVIGSGVLEIDDDQLVVLGGASGWFTVKTQYVTILCVVVCIYPNQV